MQIDTELLKHLVPLRQLQIEHRLQMLNQSHMLELEEGDQLLASEQHRWYLYLVSGKLELYDLDGQPFTIRHTDERALTPLFHEGERRTCIIARGHCRVVQFEKQLFNTFADDELLTNEELETLEMSETEALLFNVIMHDFNLGQLKLPGLPEVAKQIRTTVSNRDLDSEALTQLISVDPSIAMRLFNATRSHQSPVTTACDIGEAIEQLGLENARRLIMEFAQHAPDSYSSDLLHDHMQHLYDQSVDVSAISYALSELSGQLSPGMMRIAGLLHQAGTLLVLGYIEETGLLISSEDELEKIIEHLKSAVGYMVISHWGLPDSLLPVVAESDNWRRDSGDEIDACDLVIVARIYQRLKHHQLDDIPPFDQVPAIQKLVARGFRREFVGQVLASAHQQMTETMKLLSL